MSWFTKLRKFIAQAIYPGSNDELVKKETVQSTPLLSNTTGFQTLPVFDQNGIQIGFQCVAAQPSSVPAAISLPGQLPSSSTITIPSLQLPQTSKNWTELPTLDLSNPAPLTKFIPLDPQPPYSCEFDNGIVATALSHLPNGEWDSWPNGRFRLDLTHSEFMMTKRLAVQWATKTNTTRKSNSSILSTTVANGKVTNKKCLGVISCSNCNYIGRPQVEKTGLDKQLASPCPGCGSALQHDICSSRSFLIAWGQISGDITTTQYRYINGTPHIHSRLPHVVRTSAAEDKKFQKIYEARPNATTTQLMAGAPAPQGFGPSAADLGQKFTQKAYTSYRLREAKKKNGNGPTSAFGNLQNLQNWKQKHASVTCKDFTSSDI
ncbi:hypothetical protein EV361DRAFT_874789, partial [Lentinula raphanica]